MGSPQHPRSGALQLRGRVNVHTVLHLHELLEARLADPEPVHIEVSALEEIDTAGLQLIAAFVLTRGRPRTTVTGWSEQLRAHLEIAGLAELLG
jgi:anti-anti-sigma regulatory factor